MFGLFSVLLPLHEMMLWAFLHIFPGVHVQECLQSIGMKLLGLKIYIYLALQNDVILVTKDFNTNLHPNQW